MSIHVVSKHNIGEHAAFRVDFPSTPLAASSVRVQSHLLGLSSNNISYAALGSVLHWWDTYPVPSYAPAPYNSQSDWGIVPAWGYARVLESTIPSIAKDSYIWGYWPTASVPVDLKLEAAEPEGHWIEVSEHRKKLFNMYNRYIHVAHAVDATVSNDNRDAWTVSLRPVWECSYLMNRFTFAAPGTGVKPLHPGDPELPWTAEDADLSRAVVVSLSASGKTARGFTSLLAHGRDHATGGPLALLQATSAPSALAGFAEDSPLPLKTVHYDALTQPETLAWINEFKPARVVVVDFGAPAATLEPFITAVKAASDKAQVTIIAVGGEGKVSTAQDLLASMAQAAKLGKVQLNTTIIRDLAMQAEGYHAYFKGLSDTWQKYDDTNGRLGYTTLTWRLGVEGEQGMNGAWAELCEHKLRPGDAVVFKP